jgi:hypothetical protein
MLHALIARKRKGCHKDVCCHSTLGTKVCCVQDQLRSSVSFWGGDTSFAALVKGCHHGNAFSSPAARPAAVCGAADLHRHLYLLDLPEGHQLNWWWQTDCERLTAAPSVSAHKPQDALHDPRGLAPASSARSRACWGQPAAHCSRLVFSVVDQTSRAHSWQPDAGAP